jgi:hypothetical protein
LIDALDPGDDIPKITLELTPANNLTRRGLRE